MTHASAWAHVHLRFHRRQEYLAAFHVLCQTCSTDAPALTPAGCRYVLPAPPSRLTAANVCALQIAFAHCLRSAQLAHNRLPALPQCLLEEAKGLEILTVSSGGLLQPQRDVINTAAAASLDHWVGWGACLSPKGQTFLL